LVTSSWLYANESIEFAAVMVGRRVGANEYLGGKMGGVAESAYGDAGKSNGARGVVEGAGVRGLGVSSVGTGRA